jgi:hypothetical protein
MKEKTVNRLSYVGGGIGLALFAIFGLLPGSFLGGVLGLNIASNLFGTPVEPSVIPRIIIALGMLTGVMVAGLVFVIGGAALGWSIGTAIDTVVKPGKVSAGQEKEEESIRA